MVAATSVDRVYAAVKEMAVAYHLKPGERINEVALAKAMGASRTPLREALNRLVAERLLDFHPGKGFFCRALDPKEVFDLYEMRCLLEVSAVGIACERAGDGEIEAIVGDPSLFDWRVEGRSVRDLVAMDEQFHERIAGLTGNGELLRELRATNERIRFVRWLDMDRRVKASKSEHRRIAAALKVRDGEACAGLMRGHIERRLDRITAVVKEGYSAIYVPDAPGQRTP